MPHEELNPFAAPHARDHLSRDSDWELTIPRNGLNLLFWSLCAGTIIEFFWALAMLPPVTNSSNIWPALSYDFLFIEWLVDIFLILASRNLYRSTLHDSYRLMAAAVLSLSILMPTVEYVLPILLSSIGVERLSNWVTGSLPIVQFLFSSVLLLLLRLIAIQFKQRKAERIAGPAILLALAAALLPFAMFSRPASAVEIMSVSYASAAVVSILKGIVVYILLVHVKTLTSGTPKTEVG